jgi:hypothetical protein
MLTFDEPLIQMVHNEPDYVEGRANSVDVLGVL